MRHIFFGTYFKENLVDGDGSSTRGLEAKTIIDLDLEVTLDTPGVVPGVTDLPVLNTVLFTPTDEGDSVTTETGTRLVGVDTTSIVEEVRVDGERDRERTVLEKLLLHVISTIDGVTSLELLLVSKVVVNHSAGITLARAAGSAVGRKLGAGGVVSTIGDVVTARGEGVRVAALLVAVETTSNETSVCEPRDSRVRVTTLTTETT